jgi:hypothetical protein
MSAKEMASSEGSMADVYLTAVSDAQSAARFACALHDSLTSSIRLAIRCEMGAFMKAASCSAPTGDAPGSADAAATDWT